eukprot:4411850-Amphidinium_carterae.1
MIKKIVRIGPSKILSEGLLKDLSCCDGKFDRLFNFKHVCDGFGNVTRSGAVTATNEVQGKLRSSQPTRPLALTLQTCAIQVQSPITKV